MILIRLILLPVKVAFRLFGITLKVAYTTGKVPAKVSAFGARRVGFRGWLLLGIGIGLGLLLAPESGRELRRRLQVKLTAGPGTDTELAEKVAFELAHAPRTWHLDQPDVAVIEGRVTLRGSVASDDARDELARVASAIPGVGSVDNHVNVEPVPIQL